MIHPDRHEKPSRRRFLLALGVFGTGAAVCTCSGAVGLGAAWWLNRSSDDSAKTVIITATPQVGADSAQSLVYPDMVSRAEWGALAPNYTARNENGLYSETNPEGWQNYTTEELREIYRTVVVHHSVIYGNDDLSTVLEVQNTHREDRGWADVGYH